VKEVDEGFHCYHHIGVTTNGTAPTTFGASPRLSLWLGFGPCQGPPPPSSQHVQLFVSWITFELYFF